MKSRLEDEKASSSDQGIFSESYSGKRKQFIGGQLADGTCLRWDTPEDLVAFLEGHAASSNVRVVSEKQYNEEKSACEGRPQLKM